MTDHLEQAKMLLEESPHSDSLHEEDVVVQAAIANALIALVEELRLIWTMITEEGLPMHDKPQGISVHGQE